MKQDNANEERRRVLHFKKTTISNLTDLEMNRVLGGYSLHSEHCNDWFQTSGLPSCPDYPN
jgi:hypothetical protein